MRELQLGDLQKQVLRGKTDVRGLVDAQTAWHSTDFRTGRRTGRGGSRDDRRKSRETAS